MWITVDGLYIGYTRLKHLYLTALLYAAFVILAVFGMRQWQTALDRQSSIVQSPRLSREDLTYIRRRSREEILVTVRLRESRRLKGIAADPA